MNPEEEEARRQLTSLTIERIGRVVTITCPDEAIAEGVAKGMRLQLRGLALAFDIGELGE